jgi:SAM-dependent methyltransferase
MAYDPEATERYFDAAGFGEYERHEKSPEQRIKYELHLGCLRSFVTSGSRVLEIGAGPGRFTEVLAEMSCRISVVDLSSGQLRLNRERAHERGYAASVDAWLSADMCDLSALKAERFDAIVAFGGPFSYVLDRRDRALQECLERLEPSGHLLLSVMSKWGTIHAFLRGVYDLPAEEIEAITRTGDVTPTTSPSSASDGHFFHMFTADELREFLEGHALSVDFIAASNAVSTKWSDLLEDEETFTRVLELEDEAARSSGALDMGTHILAVASLSG